MRKKIEWQWELIDESTWRAKVIGGWMVLHVKTFMVGGSKTFNQSQSESMVFIPDRDHEWHIVPPYNPEEPKRTVKADDFQPK